MSAGVVLELPGQPRVAEILTNALARDDLGHAWAFLGPRGIGQERAARTLAAAANGAVPGEPTWERYLRGAHPGYREFVPVGAFHRVDDVRQEWLPAAQTTVREGRVKVLRIVDADRMNPQAANAFLKGLEEPPEGTVWVLDLADPDEVPDTILSRCRIVRFSPWPLEALTALAAELGIADEADRRLVARVAAGSPDEVRRLAAPGALEDHRAHRSWLTRGRTEGAGFSLVPSTELDDEVRRRTKALQEEAAAELERLVELYGDQPPRPVAKDLEERTRRREREIKTRTMQQALDDVVTWCRDVLAVGGGAGADGVVNVDALEALADDAAAVTPAALLQACDTAAVVRESLEVNVAPGLAIESFVLTLHTLTLAR